MPGPDEKPTVKLEQFEILKGLIEIAIGKVDGVDRKVDGLDSKVDGVDRRVSKIEEWKEKVVDDGLRRHSDAVRGDSQVNMKQDAAIGELVGKVDELHKAHPKQEDGALAPLATKAELVAIEKKTDAQTLILTRLDKIAENPLVRRIAYVAGSIILVWLLAVAARNQASVAHPATPSEVPATK